MSILGSREHLCVHPQISLQKGSLQNTKCRSKNASLKPCSFKLGTNKLNKKMKNVLSNNILDVEDLHLIGREQGFCPYYYEIDNCKGAEIIFMPYNYLVDDNIRPPSVNIDNSIIIFDEAHNIDSVCCDSISFDLKIKTLANCKIEIEHILNNDHCNCLISEEELQELHSKLVNLTEIIDNIPISKNQDNGFSKVYPGEYIFEILKKADISRNEKDAMIDVAQDILRELAASASSKSNVQMSTNGKYGLQTFIRSLQTIFNPKFSADSFKVHVCIKGGDVSEKCLSLWCFNPSLAIKELEKRSHCMILTSGTLSPLQSFSSELQMSFPIKLENKHLIQTDQVYVNILEKGPCAKLLSSEYKIRSSAEYMREMGNVLVNISRRIPFGILVFFVSYKHMEECVKFWYQNYLGNISFMEQLQRNKHVICEPRVGGQDAARAAFEEYASLINDHKGAMMLAVMRGKVSEGMDFRDNFARCVVICGIPYPYTKDPKILEKRDYMDKKAWEYNKKISGETMCEFGGVNGALWYQQQATRAVNQAIGRVIRHSLDYGAIILADRRFTFKRNQQHLSSWIKPHIQKTKHFGTVCCICFAYISCVVYKIY